MSQAASILGYTSSPRYIEARNFDSLPPSELRFACRKATEAAGLQGVYLLQDKDSQNHIPIVFYCKADTEEQARKIHRHVWNLNLVPFLIIEGPSRVRAYQGFHYEIEKDLAFVNVSIDRLSHSLDLLSALSATSIDNGRIFEKWGHLVTPKARVDEHLLGQLKLLDHYLRDMKLEREPSHCLIGKYVWLSYLRARGILSDWRLAKYSVCREDVFSRHAKLASFHQLNDQLQIWLNGEIFPLRGDNIRAVKSEHLQKVAAVFAGDDVSGQMALFNEIYDFSCIPIETLSVVYEQFLHQKEEGEASSEGEANGAYYTPICLADYMISELDRKTPLRDGVGVFDPACGSGAFLVQAYRRLVERTMFERQCNLRLTELRALLEDNIFGVDRDPDACGVARMSLAIALLDYANPPDVSGPTASFKLPTLAENNIIQADFFSLEPSWPQIKDKKKPQWIIGNPPWVELRTTERGKDRRNEPAWRWFDENKKKGKDAYPVSGNQVAEAFVWRVLDFCGPNTIVGLVLPAMSLFKHEAQKFRQGIFSILDVWCVANFAAIREVLFAGRARQPAMSLFFRPLANKHSSERAPIATFAPFVAEQRANLPCKAGGRLQTWNIVVRAQDWREIDQREAAMGERSTWKFAMWGSEREKRLMQRLRRFPTFAQWRVRANVDEPALGPQLRDGPADGLVFQPELVGKQRVNFKGLRASGPLFSFPAIALSPPLTESQCYIPQRASKKGVAVSYAPQLILEMTRPFAVFSDRPFIPPAQRIGIHGRDAILLKALALYLISPVARWHIFFTSSQWGISNSTSTIDDIERMPIPLSFSIDDSIRELADIYDKLRDSESNMLVDAEPLHNRAEQVVAKILQLRAHEHDLINGFFSGPWEYLEGKYPEISTKPARHAEIAAYCSTLRRELDAFLGTREVRSHITVVVGSEQALISIEGERVNDAIPFRIEETTDIQNESLRAIADKLHQQRSQWVYFEKSLIAFEQGRILFLKPLRQIEWNVRQAVLDADDIIAESLVGSN